MSLARPLFLPDWTVFAPGSPLKRLSTVRFSWTMTTMCSMLPVPDGRFSNAPAARDTPSEGGPPGEECARATGQDGQSRSEAYETTVPI